MPGNIPNGSKPKGNSDSGTCCCRMSWIVVMFTTAGVTFATSVATSGVPGRTGGVANGAGAAGAPGAGVTGLAAWAMCRSQPAPMARAAAMRRGPNLRFVMLDLSRRQYLADDAPVKLGQYFHPKQRLVQAGAFGLEMWHKAAPCPRAPN